MRTELNGLEALQKRRTDRKTSYIGSNTIACLITEPGQVTRSALEAQPELCLKNLPFEELTTTQRHLPQMAYLEQHQRLRPKKLH